MERWYYAYAGLSVASELALPEWTIFEQAQCANDPDVIILLNPLAERAQTVEPFQEIHPTEYRFFVPETGEYQIRNGREIIITPVRDAGAQELRLFLLGSAWGALCYQRGILALHTSVVQVGDHAIAFCGESGAGKSSIAAGLIARGYPLIGDDLCCFEFINNLPRVYPSAPRVKLWREALDNLGWQDENLTRDHFRTDKFHAIVSRGEAFSTTAENASPLPLRAIYLLEWGDLGLTRVTGVNALRRLIASATYRPQLIQALGQTGAYWEQCAQLARATSIWELRRPRDWAMMDAALNMLVKNL